MERERQNLKPTGYNSSRTTTLFITKKVEIILNKVS